MKEAADEAVYDAEIGISAIALEPESEEIIESLKEVRNGSAS